MTIYSDMNSSADSQSSRISLRLMSSGNFGLVIGNSSTSWINESVSSSSYLDENWHHIVQVVNGTSVKLYADGNTTPIADLTSTVSAGTLGEQSLIFGRLGHYNGQYFNGSIDQVRIYSTALTSSQVTELYEEKPCADTSNFKTVLYEGNGGTQYISNVGFDLDVDDGGDGGLVWIKARTTGVSHSLQDTVNGEGQSKNLYPDNTGYLGQYGVYGFLSTFEANGFFVDAGSGNHTNGNNQDYVAWVWKGGGDAVNIGVNTITGSTPSIASDVSANTEAGFSIVKYTGNTGADQTVATGLTTPCDIVIVKRLTDSGYSWCVGVSVVGNCNNLYLDSSGALLVRDRIKSVQSETFTVQQVHEVNNTGEDYIAYCFHSVPEYSKIGSYAGTGIDGNAIYLDSNGDGTGTGGFQPSFILIKRTDSPDNWNIVDNQRGNNGLFPDVSSQELSNSGAVVFNTNGFTINGGAGGYNNGSGTYLYMAFK